MCMEKGRPHRAAPTNLSDEVREDIALWRWEFDSGLFARFDTAEEPSHVSAHATHDLHPFQVLHDLVGVVAVDHIPILPGYQRHVAV